MKIVLSFQNNPRHETTKGELVSNTHFSIFIIHFIGISKEIFLNQHIMIPSINQMIKMTKRFHRIIWHKPNLAPGV